MKSMFAGCSLSIAAFLLLSVPMTGNAQGDGQVVKLHFVETAPSTGLRDAIEDLFNKGHFLRLNYAPEGTKEGKVDQSSINTDWIYSVTENCAGPCSRLSSSIRTKLLTARRIEGTCPPPFHFELQILDPKEASIESFAFSLEGTCFVFRNVSYGVAPADGIGKGLMSTAFNKIFLLY
jgi:hypothetical protein